MPFAPRRGGSPDTGFSVAEPCTLTWADGSVGYFIADPPADAINVYTFRPEIDTTVATWLVVAVQGLGAPLLVKEADEAHLDTLIAAVPATGIAGTPQWAVLGWLEGATFLRSRQNTGAAANQTAGTGGGTGTPKIIQTSADGVHGAKAIPISPGAPPADWFGTGFDDSAWPLALRSPDAPAFIVASVHEGPDGQTLFRVPFTLDATELTNVSLIILDDIQYNRIYVNGHLLDGTPFSFAGGGGSRTIPIPDAMLALGANLLAVWNTNDADAGAPTGDQFGGIDYTIQQGGTGGAGSGGGSGGCGCFGNVPVPPPTITPVLNTNDASAITAKVFNAVGGTPADWTAVAFNDSAWPLALHSSEGANYLVSPTPEGPNGILLFRDHFSVADLASTDHVVVSIKVDNALLALSVNGHALPIAAGTPGAYAGYTADRSLLVAGDNVLAVEMQNDADAFGGVGYNLSTATASLPQGITMPPVVEGGVLIGHGGQWIVLQPGANGTVLTMVGGLPAWA